MLIVDKLKLHEFKEPSKIIPVRFETFSTVIPCTPPANKSKLL